MAVADGVDGSPTHFVFSYGTGSPISVPTGSNLQCTSSSCQHTFSDTSHHVQQYTVSVAARNVVGMGNASTTVTVGMHKMNTSDVETDSVWVWLCETVKLRKKALYMKGFTLRRKDSLCAPARRFCVSRKGGTGRGW